MRINKSCFSFIILFIISVSLGAQQDNAKAHKDSLLNVITDIDTRLKEFSAKDTTKGFSASLKIDTAYANKLQKSHLPPLRDQNGLLIVSNDWTPFADYISFRDTVIFEPAYLPVVFDGQILPRGLDFVSKYSEAVEANEFHLISFLLFNALEGIFIIQ